MKVRAISTILALLLTIGLITYSQSSDPSVPCEQPLTYRFGDIDPRFNVSEEQLSEIMLKVEDLWSDALGRNLLDYDKNGKVVINLVFGEEQARTDDERKFSQRIEVKSKEIEVFQKEYDRFTEQYKEQREAFQTTVDKYNRAIDSYNTYTKSLSGKPVPSDAKNRLQRMQRTIDRLKAEMKREEQNLETLRKQVNTKSHRLNERISVRNEMVDRYNKRFSDSRRFDQGRYIKMGQDEKINIFQFSNLAQLKTVLAHEAGHAFGLGHVNNPESIMHEMMSEQNIFNLQLTEEDISAMKSRCSY